MVKAKQRPDGRWYGAIYMGKDIYGKKKYKHIYANSEKECNNKIIEFEYKKNNGLLEEEIKNNKLITLEDYWNEWLDNKIGLSYSTIKEYSSIKKCHLNDILKMNAKDVNYSVIQHFYSDLYKRTNAKRVKRVSVPFNCFLKKMSIRRDCPVPRDILDGLELPSTEKFVPTSINDTEYRYIINELLKEYNNIKSTIGYLYIIILIASGCGCRLGELTALTLDDVDFEKNLIKITKQQVVMKNKGYVIIEKTKSATGTRNIAILPTVSKQLKKHIEKQKNLIYKLKQYNFEPERICFIQKDGSETYISSYNLLITNTKGYMIRKNTAQRNWKHFKVSKNINSNMRIHDFRRFFATLLMKNGVPDIISKKQLGHSKIDMTQYYQNADEDLIQEYIKNIDLKTN